MGCGASTDIEKQVEAISRTGVKWNYGGVRVRMIPLKWGGLNIWYSIHWLIIIFSIKMTILGASPIFKQTVATKLGIQSNCRNMFCTRYNSLKMIYRKLKGWLNPSLHKTDQDFLNSSTLNASQAWHEEGVEWQWLVCVASHACSLCKAGITPMNLRLMRLCKISASHLADQCFN